MPPGAAGARGAQLATVAALGHRELLRPEVEADLDVLDGDGDADVAAAVRLARRLRARAARLPETLVREITEASSRSVTTWMAAKPAEDLPAYLDALRPLVALKREEARLLADGGEAYDALIDQFEPGARASELGALLDGLIARVRPLVDELDGDGGPDLPERMWPADAQVALGHDLARAVGFDLRCGLVGLTAHPVTMALGAGDTRFSTRVDERDPFSSLMAVMHELGHALYDQGLPDRYARTLLWEAPSLGAHESQSRFWENHVARSAAFWSWAEPRLRERFPDQMDGITPDGLRRGLNRVRRSLVRTEADEVTYDLHIALRFRLERALIAGDLEVDDLPGAWDEGMVELLGLRPPSPSLGVMQDVHWPAGMIGYFPTYSLGNVYAAQLAAALAREVGPIDEVLPDQGFAPLLGFMRERVHDAGNRLPTPELMRAATGAPIGIDDFVAHLEATYRP